MLRRFLAWIGIPGEVVTEHGKLRPGAAQVEGVLRTSSPVVSPIHRRKCAGFNYRARFAATRVIRGSQTGQRALRTATVYAPDLVLEVIGGNIDLVAPRSDDFTSEDHQALAASDIPGFSARETRIKLDARVRAHGRLRRVGDRWVLKFVGLVILGDA